MALSITHLGLNEINNHVDGRLSMYQIIDDGNLNDQDVRQWGAANHDDTYVGVAGHPTLVNTVSQSEISMGEFRNAEAPTIAFDGTMTAEYDVVASGEQYVPSSYYSGFLEGSRGAHTNKTFTGTIGGAYATHTLHRVENFGVQSIYGLIHLQIRNTSGAAYNASATDWTKMVVGSTTWNRTDANSISKGVSAGSTYHYYNVIWGRYYPTPGIYYNMDDYWSPGLSQTATYNNTFYIDF